MSLDPVTAGIDAVTAIVSRIWPDKTESEKAQIAAAVQMVSAQTNIDQAEAQSSDPLQHWRGALGWVCAFGYAYSFVLQPLMGAVATMIGHPVTLPTLDISQLSALTVGMLGLGGLHVTEKLNGVK